jgi:hypothetical protein
MSVYAIAAIESGLRSGFQPAAIYAPPGAAIARAQLIQQKASSPRDSIVDSSTIGALQCAQRKAFSYRPACGSEPEPLCSIASAQLGQQ